MSGLVEFLQARLDEVAELAQAVHGPEDAPWWSAEDIKTRLCDDQIWMHDAEHMTRHSPARVLADVAAKRELVDAYKALAERGDAGEPLSQFERGTLTGLYRACWVLAKAEGWQP